jgi:hypothetical protein
VRFPFHWNLEIKSANALVFDRGQGEHKYYTQKKGEKENAENMKLNRVLKLPFWKNAGHLGLEVQPVAFVMRQLFRFSYASGVLQVSTKRNLTCAETSRLLEASQRLYLEQSRAQIFFFFLQLGSYCVLINHIPRNPQDLKFSQHQKSLEFENGLLQSTSMSHRVDFPNHNSFNETRIFQGPSVVRRIT